MSKAELRPPPHLDTPRLVLQMASAEDVPAIVAYHRRNHDFHAGTMPARPPDYHAEAACSDRVVRAAADFAADRGLQLFLFPRVLPARVIGAIGFSQIVRGAFHACYLGYSLDREERRKGLMTEALRAAIEYVFGELNLHRIMANHLPGNERSARLLRRLGFVVEGYARDYLQIAGRWQDHILTSLTNPNWRGA